MKAIVSLSGGMDSTTVLALAIKLEKDVISVGFTYGSKHNKYENEAAERIASHYGISFRLIDLSQVMSGFKSDLLLSGDSIPEGHYEEESMRRTVVPARNIIFCSVLTGIAVSEDAEQIWLGVHAGDHFIYPDCRPEFIRVMQATIQCGTERAIVLITPFLHSTKKHILQEGLLLKVPYHLTRTCYKDQTVACGRCGSCQERLAAWKEIGEDDPLEYESREIMPKGTA